jgi:hypothetical protein
VVVRRLYTDPESGQLVAMESTRRVFDGHQRRLLVLRDGQCRTPWCGAPIRHADHVVAHADGGPTSLGNGQGLCERCNQTKTLPGWGAEVLDVRREGAAGRHTVRTTTPTGHHDDSVAPPLLGGSPSASPAAADMAAPQSNDPPRRLDNEQRACDVADAWMVDASALERELEDLIREGVAVLCDGVVGHAPR